MKRPNYWVCICALVFLFHSVTAAEKQDVWEPLQFLVGDWEAVAKPAEAKGQFTFSFDLQSKIMVRRNHAEYPASNGRPGFTHDDLMIIYREDAPSALHAIYFDVEDHVIHYTVQTSPGAKVTFVSEVMVNMPRYRLSYDRLPDGKLHGKFEIAPPGKPEAFSKYLEWEAQRPAEGKSQRP
jgi:hypothetical protein